MAWYIEGTCVDPANYVNAGFEQKPGYEGLSVWSGGEPVAPELVPSTARVRSDRRQLPCFFAVSTALAVCDAFRTLVESLEPGRHQFLPVTMLRRSGDPYPGRFYLLNALQKVDAIIVEKSDVIWHRIEAPQPDGTVREGRWLEIRGMPQLTLNADAIAGRHLWLDRHGGGHLFFSNELMEQVNRAKLRKLRWFQTQEE
jgi:hypothetical protein